MSDTPKNIARLMKRCQIGVGGPNAIDDAHDIMAECYGTLGKLSADLAAVTRERDEAREAFASFDALFRGVRQLRDEAMKERDEAAKERDALRAEVERLRGAIMRVWNACQNASHKPANSPELTRLWVAIGAAHGSLQEPTPFLGMKVVVDLKMPAGTIEMRSGNQTVSVTNLDVPQEPTP